MKKGYQIIDAAGLKRLLAVTTSFDLTIALLSWLVELLHGELRERLTGVEIEIIRAEYYGPYPAIGIHYPMQDTNDVGPLVETTIEELLKQRPVADFSAFLARTPTDWRKATDDLIGRQP